MVQNNDEWFAWLESQPIRWRAKYCLGAISARMSVPFSTVEHITINNRMIERYHQILARSHTEENTSGT